MGYWTGEINGEGVERESKWEGGVSKEDSPYNIVVGKVYLIIPGTI
jgi:hypothetical protein